MLWLMCGPVSDLLLESRGVWMVWQEIHSSVGFFPPSIYHLLPCIVCISACIPAIRCKPGYLLVFTEPMGNAWLLAIPNSGCLWCSFPLSYQHLHLLPSPVGSRHQTVCSTNTPEFYHIHVKHSREQFHRILLQGSKNFCSLSSLQLRSEILLRAECICWSLSPRTSARDCTYRENLGSN